MARTLNSFGNRVDNNDKSDGFPERWQRKELISFTVWLQEKNLSPKTIQTYTKGIRHYGWTPLTTNNVIDFFKRNSEKLDPATLISRKTALKCYSKFQRSEIEWERITPFIPRVQRKFFTTINRDELEQLKNARFEASNQIYERNNLLIDFLFYTGTRVGEITKIKHHDYQDKSLRILGKGNKVRHVFLPPFLVKKINPWSRGYLFSNCWGNKNLSIRIIDRIIQKRTQVAGINKRITPHTFRRSFATLLYNRCGKLTTVQKLLGHSHITTTAQYIHNDFDTLYADYSKLWKDEPPIIKEKEIFEN